MIYHEISLAEYIDRGRAKLRTRVRAQIRHRGDLGRLDAGSSVMRVIDRIHALGHGMDATKRAGQQLELFAGLT